MYYPSVRRHLVGTGAGASPRGTNKAGDAKKGGASLQRKRPIDNRPQVNNLPHILNAVLLWDFRHQFPRIVNLPALDHAKNPPRILDVLQRVGVENYNVRKLSRLDRAQIFFNSQSLRRRAGSCAQRVNRRQSGFHQVFQFRMQSVPRQRGPEARPIGSRQQSNASLVTVLDELLPLSKPAIETCCRSAGSFHRSGFP